METDLVEENYKKIRTLKTFKGLVIPSSQDNSFHGALSGITGPHYILYPTNVDDVVKAVQHFGAENEQLLIRSGIQRRKNRIEDGVGKIVINLKNLKKISFGEDNKVEIQAGSLIKEVIKSLAEKGMVLPLTDNPLKSISSNLLNEEEDPSSLKRSLGTLASRVSRIDAVKKNGEIVIFASLEEYKKEKEAIIITQIEFQAAPAKNLWMLRFSAPYSGLESFQKIANNLRKQIMDISEQAADLMLDIYKGRKGVPLMRLAAIHYSEDRQEPQISKLCT